MGMGRCGSMHRLRERVLMRRILRRQLRATTVATGLTIGFAALGRPGLAFCTGAIAAIAALFLLHNLIRSGDR